MTTRFKGADNDVNHANLELPQLEMDDAIHRFRFARHQNFTIQEQNPCCFFSLHNSSLEARIIYSLICSLKLQKIESLYFG